jgi:ABC-type glycerol-3-phosphate transport system substrate-binding protein
LLSKLAARVGTNVGCRAQNSGAKDAQATDVQIVDNRPNQSESRNSQAKRKVASTGKFTFLNRVPGEKMFRTGLLTEAFLIPSNSPKKKEAKEFLSFFVSPEGNTIYNQHVNLAPTNTKSTATKLAERIMFNTPSEREQFAVNFDAGYLASVQAAMTAKWETEVAPFIK